MHEFTLRRSARARRARLTVRDDGNVIVTIPERAPRRFAEQLVANEARWIERHRSRALAEAARLARRRPLGQGGLITVEGVPHLVTLQTEPARRRPVVEPMSIPHPALHIRRGPGDRSPPRKHLERWLRGRARQVISERVRLRASQLEVQPGRISIRDQRTRWASASATGGLSFNWRLVLAPPAILDYVVVHELAHLVRLGHDRRFWGLVHRILPDAEASRVWLRRNGRELRAALY
jgi:predicted metal-dependent hydrolase